MKCRKAIRQLPAYLDHELEEAAAAELQAHLARCVFCSTELASLRTTSTMLDAWEGASPRRSTVGAVIAQIRAEEDEAPLRARLLRGFPGRRVAYGMLRAAGVFTFVMGAIVFSGKLPVQVPVSSVASGGGDHLLSAKEAISLDEYVNRSYMSPSEYGLALKGIENGGRAITTSFLPMPPERFFDTVPRSNAGRFLAVDHVYFPGEGMPVESIIPMELK
jgi:hypothetical protein